MRMFDGATPFFGTTWMPVKQLRLCGLMIVIPGSSMMLPAGSSAAVPSTLALQFMTGLTMVAPAGGLRPGA